MPPLRIALLGVGRMGSAIDALAATRNCEVVARFGRPTAGRQIDSASLNGAQVALEFSTPDASFDNAVACVRAHCPVVVGTTGWSDRLHEFGDVVEAAACAALVAANFSIGVHLFLGLAEDAARRLRAVPAFAPHLVETHHAAKRDAPSGTALQLQQVMQLGAATPIPITSVRVGSVPGTHALIFDAPFEQIRLEHEARDRRVFADGALVAAQWLARQSTPAVYTMRDVLDGVLS